MQTLQKEKKSSRSTEKCAPSLPSVNCLCLGRVTQPACPGLLLPSVITQGWRPTQCHSSHHLPITNYGFTLPGKRRNVWLTAIPNHSSVLLTHSVNPTGIRPGSAISRHNMRGMKICTDMGARPIPDQGGSPQICTVR